MEYESNFMYLMLEYCNKYNDQFKMMLDNFEYIYNY